MGIVATASLALTLSTCGTFASGDCALKATCLDSSALGYDGAAPGYDAAAQHDDAAPVIDAEADVADGAVYSDVSVDGPADSAGPDAESGPGADGGVDATPDSGQEAGDADATVDGRGDGGPDSSDEGIPDSTAVDGEAGLGCKGDGGSIGTGLVVFYKFDEANGTTAFDSSGKNRNATMQGATFTRGLKGNAATLNGTNQYVLLPNGILNGLTSFSFSAWVQFSSADSHSRVFDLGSGRTDYMFLWWTTSSRFAITTSGGGGEQKIDVPVLPAGTWQHAVVTLTDGAGILYVNGVEAAHNAGITLTPASLGLNDQNYLGRSQYTTDPYATGQLDNVRIYDRALSPCEVLQLFQQQL